MSTLEGEQRIPAGCSLCGMIDRRGKRFAGDKIIKSIALMHDRSNGLGGGFAAYGIYPEYKDFYALHLMFMDQASRDEVERIIKENFSVEAEERIPDSKLEVHRQTTDSMALFCNAQGL